MVKYSFGKIYFCKYKSKISGVAGCEHSYKIHGKAIEKHEESTCPFRPGGEMHEKSSHKTIKKSTTGPVAPIQNNLQPNSKTTEDRKNNLKKPPSSITFDQPKPLINKQNKRKLPSNLSIPSSRSNNTIKTAKIIHLDHLDTNSRLKNSHDETLPSSVQVIDTTNTSSAAIATVSTSIEQQIPSTLITSQVALPHQSRFLFSNLYFTSDLLKISNQNAFETYLGEYEQKISIEFENIDIVQTKERENFQIMFDMLVQSSQNILKG